MPEERVRIPPRKARSIKRLSGYNTSTRNVGLGLIEACRVLKRLKIS
jgi:hypothetical protein